MAIGTNANPLETVITAACGCFCNVGNSAAVSRIGPRRLVVTMASASARSLDGSSTFSGRMMPALLMTALSPGNSSVNLAANDRMLPASVMSTVRACMPGLAAAVSSSVRRVRPEMMT